MMRSRDIANATLVRLVAAVAVSVVTWFALRGLLPQAWRTPGSPALYLTGLAGALLLLVPGAFALAKRGGNARDPLGWFNAHVMCSLAGAVLIAIHSAGFVRRPPALLLLAVLALGALGVWARVRGARQMAATFASKAPAFRVPDNATRERLKQIIDAKQRLLVSLDPAAREGLFSVTLAHWVHSPRLAFAYRALAREETLLLGARAAVSLAQAWWRPLHLWLAWMFMAGVLIHVITVTFFAGYVAGDGPVTWWHMAEW